MMSVFSKIGAALLVGAMTIVPSVRAGDASQAEIEKLKKDIEDLRKKVSSSSMAMPKSATDRALDSKYGPNAPVTTKSGKLTLGGMVQVWYYSIQNDNQGLFNDPAGTGIADTNEASDNDSFRIRRAELNLTMDIHENVTSYVMLDFAREAGSFPNMSTNQGYKTANNLSPEFAAANGVPGSTGAVSSVQFGSGGVPNILQDALINFHGVVPHHDFTVGQYLPTFSEEDFGPNSMLDFVERSFIGNAFARELGVTIHGSWWDNGGGGAYCGGGDSGRFQYWLSAFNGAGNWHQTGGQSQNRSDDNDGKDFLATFLVRPVWKQETWGSLELGWSSGIGSHGESSGKDPVANPVNGLNRNANSAIRHSGWMSYRPGGPVRGWWLKGEWAWVKDRNAPGSVVDLTGSDANGIGFQTSGKPFHTTGFYISTGYRISQSCFSECGCNWLHDLEFALRYEQFDNVYIADPAVPDTHTNVYQTKVLTPGINYYIKGHNAKIQANYNFVRNPDGPAAAPFHDVKNDSFVVNFQVMF
jgi:hypothetical protein